MVPDCKLAGCFTPGLAAGQGKARSTSVLPREVAGERYQGEKQRALCFQGKESRLWVQEHPQQGEEPPCCKTKPLEVAPRTKSP